MKQHLFIPLIHSSLPHSLERHESCCNDHRQSSKRNWSSQGSNREPQVLKSCKQPTDWETWTMRVKEGAIELGHAFYYGFGTWFKFYLLKTVKRPLWQEQLKKDYAIVTLKMVMLERSKWQENFVMHSGLPLPIFISAPANSPTIKTWGQ